MIKNIRIKQADKVACSREWSWISDDNGWAGYHFWYVKSGIGHIEVEGEVYDIYGGDCFCFDLSRNHRCTHNPEHPLEVFTVYFQADFEEEAIVRRIVRNDKVLGEALERSIVSYEKGDDDLAVMWIFPVIGVFTRENDRKEPGNEKISVVKKYLEEHLEQDFSLEEMARVGGYSRNQMIRLFKKELGHTPAQYFTELKMEQAKKMMRYSSMSVTEIAVSVGYMDISYFSKVFKKYVGCSPREYGSKVKTNGLPPN